MTPVIFVLCFFFLSVNIFLFGGEDVTVARPLESIHMDSSRKQSRHFLYMGVSKNRFFLHQINNFNRVFHYKPSILGYHYFWKQPYLDVGV